MTEPETLQGLADRIANRIVQKNLYEEALKILLLSLQEEIREGVLQALLTNKDIIVTERDAKWIQGLSSAWVQEDPEGLPPTTPEETSTAIRRWYSARELKLRKELYRKGREDGFVAGVSNGTRIGFVGAQVGSTLEEVLEKGKTIKDQG